MLYRSVNFWLLDITASLLVFISAWYGKKTRRSQNPSEVTGEVPSPAGKDGGPGDQMIKSHLGATFQRLFVYTAYFALMAVSVILLQSYTYLMIFVQHITVIFCILTAFLQWCRPHVAVCVGAVFSITWIASASTTFRWILNDGLIALFSLLVSHVHFKNFPSLQMFLWIALLYDIYLVKTIFKGYPSMFSAGDCKTLLCNALEINNEWELPTIFTFKFGPREGHVFLGAGDIMIGCLVANFSQMFFKSPRYLSGTVLSFALAIALLNWVEDEPYPALLTIVPLCTCQLVVSAFWSHKARKLFSFSRLENGEKERETWVEI